MRVLVVGDVHANWDFMRRALDRALELGAQELWQVGDFGYWPRTDQGHTFLRLTNQLSLDYNIPIYFADGNHEDHDHLFQGTSPYPVISASGKVVFDHLFHVPRGVTLQREDKTIMFIGGAASVDRKWRIEGTSWFPQEVLQSEEIDRILASEPVDIVLAHDAPSWANLQLSSSLWPPEDIRLSEQHRFLMTTFCDKLQPTLWIHGHYHQRAITFGDKTTIMGLAHDQLTLNDATYLLHLDLL